MKNPYALAAAGVFVSLALTACGLPGSATYIQPAELAQQVQVKMQANLDELANPDGAYGTDYLVYLPTCEEIPHAGTKSDERIYQCSMNIDTPGSTEPTRDLETVHAFPDGKWYADPGGTL